MQGEPLLHLWLALRDYPEATRQIYFDLRGKHSYIGVHVNDRRTKK
jgi:hypothetical protein